MEFDSTRVLVTGGTRGIGRAIVEAFATRGARVAFTYRSSGELAAKLSRELGILGFQGDAADFDSASQIVKAVVSQFGGLDVLVNNAGITRDRLLLRMSERDWDDVISANLKSCFNYAKAACRPMMRQRQGRIINLSSVVGLNGNAGQVNYAAAKAGIIGFTKSLAKELAKRNITANVVAPGFVETDMTRHLKGSTLDALLQSIPLGRTASPEEIALPVLFLASPAAAYITGHVLTVDGGLSM